MFGQRQHTLYVQRYTLYVVSITYNVDNVDNVDDDNDDGDDIFLSYRTPNPQTFTTFFCTLFTRKGTLKLTPGIGDGRGGDPRNPKQIQQMCQKYIFNNISYLLYIYILYIFYIFAYFIYLYTLYVVRSIVKDGPASGN